MKKTPLAINLFIYIIRVKYSCIYILIYILTYQNTTSLYHIASSGLTLYPFYWHEKKIIDDHKTHLDFKITCKTKVLIDEDSWKWQIPTSLFFFSFCFNILFWNGSKLDWFSSPPRKQKSINLFSDTFVPRWEGLNPYWITCTQSDRV